MEEALSANLGTVSLEDDYNESEKDDKFENIGLIPFQCYCIILLHIIIMMF